MQHLHQSFSSFIGMHLAVDFEEDPEAHIRQFNARRTELERALNQHESNKQQR